MFRVLFFSGFGKKPNSTKRPSNADEIAAWKYDCILKEPSSIINPIITVDLSLYDDGEYMGNITPSRWNYAYIEKFNRYYYITDIISDAGLFTFYLKCDVLASYKDDIENEEAYIVRSSKYRDAFIADATFPAKVNYLDYTVDFDDEGGELTTNGCYIVGVINPEASYTAVSYYALSGTQFGQLKTALFSVANYTASLGALEISDELLKILYNPFQYISSVLYVPFSVSAVAGVNTPDTIIQFGWWSGNTGISASGKKISDTDTGLIYIGSSTYNGHPAAGQNDTLDDDGKGVAPFDGMGKYLNYAPYTHYYFRLEPFGMFELENQLMGDLISYHSEDNTITLQFYIRLDTITGRGYLHIFPEIDDFQENYKFTPKETVLGVPLQLGQITADTMGGITSGVSRTVSALSESFGGMALSAVTGNLLGAAGAFIGGAANVTAAIYDGFKIASPKLQTNGSNGSFAAYNELQYGIIRCANICENDPEEVGYPLMRKVLIKDCKPGFVQCGFTDIIIASATETEKHEVIEHLTHGIHLED